MDKLDDKSRAEIVFVGSTLGPASCLHDPEHDAQVVATGLEALASLDVEKQPAKDWPFVSAEDAERALALMHEGLAVGTKSDALPRGNTVVCSWVRWQSRRRPGVRSTPTRIWSCSALPPCSCATGCEEIGIAIEKGESDEPEDHIGTMLVLLAWLAEERPELVDEFLCDHLLTWTLSFSGAVRKRLLNSPSTKDSQTLPAKALKACKKSANSRSADPRFDR